MGFKVSVGNVVWNQHKKILTDDSSKTRLIYSSDIVNIVNIVTTLLRTPNTGDEEEASALPEPVYSNYQSKH